MEYAPKRHIPGEALMDYGRWKVLWLDTTYVMIFRLYLEVGELYGYCEELEEESGEVPWFSSDGWN